MDLQRRQKGHYLTVAEWNEVVKMQQKLKNITGDKTSGILVQNKPDAVIISVNHWGMAYYYD